MDSSTWSDAQAAAYIASYADLRLTLGGNLEEARRHYAAWGAVEGRTITFDPLRYIASHADLRAAYGTDVVAAARHFIQFGAQEGRAVTFDAFGYLASYADLRAAYGANSAAATTHFIGFGAKEGRAVTFDALGYLASYGDLRAAYGADTVAATRHYVQFGASEGRGITFDALGYLASYSDLRAAFGTDSLAATRHFLGFGAAEGRTVTFDGVAYLLTNADLAAAGFDAAAATRHWLTRGIAEGRTQSGAFGNEQTSHALPSVGTVSGAIDRAGDRDWFSLNLTAGQGIGLDFLPSNGNGVLTLYDATGRQVTPSDIGGARTSFIAPRTGIYYVVASTANAATGSYSLGLSNFTLTGTSGSDTLTGTDGADVLRGLDGSDTLNGRGGNDVLEGGSGLDQLDGGLGDDILYGNNAANSGFDNTYDYLNDTQGGNDQLFGQDGDDNLSVSRFNYSGNMAASTVLLDGGTGNDNINFSSSRFLDTVTIRGGAGNDTISVGPVLQSTIDAGEGNDKVTIGMSGGDQTITLGAGADVLVLDGFSNAIAIGNPTRITDFATGTDVLSIDQYLAATLTNWDKATNPFATGHLKLVQSGADTLLQIDRDGSAGTGYALGTLLTLANANAVNFTAKDLGYAPDGSAAVGMTLTGTSGSDTLTGTDGADVLRGLDGSDTLTGRGGNDVLEGGAGLDQLDGGLGDDLLYGNNAANSGFDNTYDYLNDTQGGNDQLFGQDGDDSLSVSRFNYSGNMAASTVLLDGGTGDDNINFFSSRFVDTVTIHGGAGNDTMSVGPVLQSTIDAGEGNDKVTIGMSGGDQTITLGAGADVLVLYGFSSVIAIGNPTRISDFATGTDTLSMDQYLAAALTNWDKVTNPFATGHLKLVQSGADTLLQIDRDGGAGTGYALGTLLTLANTDAASFTAKDLGYAPDGSAAVGMTLTGASGNDTLLGTEGADVLRGLDGNDTLNGRGGNDVLEGGSGYDQLDGGLGDDILYGNNAANSGYDAYDNLSDTQGGNDQLFGQDGDDSLSVSRYDINGSVAASTVLLDGGAGNDRIYFSSSRFVDTVTIRGGAGNDTISTGSVRQSTIDAGDGHDKVTIGMRGGDQTITLGAGADVLVLEGLSYAIAIGNPTRVTDFVTGTDLLSIDEYLAATLTNWDKATNPFATGHLKLVQSGADTLLQIDRDGSAGTSDALGTLLTFANTNAASFTAKDLGYAPGSATGLSAEVTGYSYDPAAFNSGLMSDLNAVSLSTHVG